MGKFLFGIEGQIRARRRLRMHTQDILFCRSGHPPSLTSGEHAKNFNHLRANNIPHYHISANSHVLPHRTKISLVQKLEVSTLLSALITGRGRGSSCALLARDSLSIRIERCFTCTRFLISTGLSEACCRQVHWMEGQLVTEKQMPQKSCVRPFLGLYNIPILATPSC